MILRMIYSTLINFHLFVTGLVQTTILRRRIYSTLINFDLFVTGLVRTMILRRRIYSTLIFYISYTVYVKGLV